jgi:hypothetical protein
MSTKLDVIQTNQKQVETGLTAFDLSVTSVINDLKEEGTKIKAMVDRHIEKMIATLREKTRYEKELLTKTLVNYIQQFRLNVLRPVSTCFWFVWITSSFVLISSLKVVLRLEIDFFILETLWPLCFPVTHCEQTVLTVIVHTFVGNRF